MKGGPTGIRRQQDSTDCWEPLNAPTALVMLQLMVNVKCDGKGHTRTGHKGTQGNERYISTHSLTSALDGVCGLRHGPVALPPGKRPSTHLQEVGWTPGSVWTGTENLTPTGTRPPDRLAPSESLMQCASFKGRSLQMPQLNVTSVRTVTTNEKQNMAATRAMGCTAPSLCARSKGVCRSARL